MVCALEAHVLVVCKLVLVCVAAAGDSLAETLGEELVQRVRWEAAKATA